MHRLPCPAHAHTGFLFVHELKIKPSLRRVESGGTRVIRSGIHWSMAGAWLAGLVILILGRVDPDLADKDVSGLVAAY